MIISASRRTDIPAFYARWLINRLRAGFCCVPNPFNPSQVAEISLVPESVDVIVFWTRNPRPLFPYLEEMDRLGYRYYFQFTLLDYPRSIEQHNPPTFRSIKTFRDLVDRVGTERVVWRYDPIILSETTPMDFHCEKFARLADALEGNTKRAVISFLDLYPRVRRRMAALVNLDMNLSKAAGSGRATGIEYSEELSNLASRLAGIASQHGMEIVSCAEEGDLQPFGINAGKCIDDVLIQRVFGLDVDHTKDPGQRKFCGCVTSKDIGMYETCPFGCQYCYANYSFKRSFANFQRHNPNSCSLL